MDDIKDRLNTVRELLKATETDRDAWKELAQKTEDKLVILRHALREALEVSE